MTRETMVAISSVQWRVPSSTNEASSVSRVVALNRSANLQEKSEKVQVGLESLGYPVDAVDTSSRSFSVV